MLKKTLVLVAMFLPASVFAASVHFGDYFLKGAEIAPDDIYTMGSTATFAGFVDGDAVSLGETIFSQSDISGDAMFFGKEVRVEGEVGDDARLVGGIVTIDGTVKDDVIVLGSKVIVTKSARIEGSLYVLGGEVDVQGTVLGDAKVVSDKFFLSGTVKGDLELWGDASFAKPAEIGGDFIRHSKTRRPPLSVVITGKVIEADASRGFAELPLRPLLGGYFSLKTLMMLTLGFALFFLAKERTEAVLQETLPSVSMRVLRGLLIVIIMPIVIAVLMPSVIGIPIALVLTALFLLLLILSWAYAGILLGAWMEWLLFKRSPFPLTYRPVLLGILLLSIISLIPYVGAIVQGVLLLASAGSLGTLFWREMRTIR